MGAMSAVVNAQLKPTRPVIGEAIVKVVLPGKTEPLLPLVIATEAGAPAVFTDPLALVLVSVKLPGANAPEKSADAFGAVSVSPRSAAIDAARTPRCGCRRGWAGEAARALFD